MVVLKRRGLTVASKLSKIDKFNVIKNNDIQEAGRFPVPHAKHGRYFHVKRMVTDKYRVTSADDPNKLHKKYLHYSCSANKVVCLACAFFGVFKYEKEKSQFVTGSNNWKKITTADTGFPYNFRRETLLSAIVLCD